MDKFALAGCPKLHTCKYYNAVGSGARVRRIKAKIIGLGRVVSHTSEGHFCLFTRHLLFKLFIRKGFFILILLIYCSCFTFFSMDVIPDPSWIFSRIHPLFSGLNIFIKCDFIFKYF